MLALDIITRFTDVWLEGVGQQRPCILPLGAAIEFVHADTDKAQGGGAMKAKAVHPAAVQTYLLACCSLYWLYCTFPLGILLMNSF
jgi:hypothetical protein